MRHNQGQRTHMTPEGLTSEAPTVSETTRPWGGFRQYAHNRRVTVSLMTVEPGGRLSLQAHTRRAEFWIVLDDGAVVQRGDEIQVCRAGDELWIPAGERHRLSCSGPHAVRVLEVAFGDWDVNDITRYDDDYGRADGF